MNKNLCNIHDYAQKMSVKKRYVKPSDQPSLTVPDQALTIRQIFDLFRAGKAISDQQPIYYSGGDFDDFDETKAPDFDLSDVSRIDMEIKTNRKMRENAKKQKEYEILEQKKELEKGLLADSPTSEKKEA